MKFFIITTIPTTLGFFRGQPRIWSERFDVCAVSSMRKELEAFGRDEGIRTHYIPMEREISLLKDVYSLLCFIWLFLRERPEVVHGNTPKGALLSMAAAWLTRRPVRLYMCHGLRYQGFSGRFRRMLMFMERLTCRFATQVITVGSSTREALVADGLCPAEKVKVVGYGSLGIDLTRYAVCGKEEKAALRQKHGLSADDFVYLFIGRLVHDKGVNELVEAFLRLSQENPHAHLVILGSNKREADSVSEATIEKITQTPSIHYLGQQADVRPFFSLCDVFVLPSYREGLSMVLIESGAMGRPAITCAVTGCKEIVADGENGWLIPPRDAGALYEAMATAAAHPERLEAFGHHAREIVEERYERQKVWQAYWKVYKSLGESLN